MDIILFGLIKSVGTGLLLGGVFLLMALGLTTIFEAMEVVNFAHGEFLLIGMYTTLFCTPFLGGYPVLTLPICALTGAILGIGCYFGLIRHLLRSPMIAQLFGTFGMMLFLRNLVLVLMESQSKEVHPILSNSKNVLMESDPALLSVTLIATIVSLLAFWGIWRWTVRFLNIKLLSAITFNNEPAAVTEFSFKWANPLACALGGSSAAVAGGILANLWPATPNIAMLFAAIAFATVALSGFTSVKGTIAVGVLIGITTQAPPVLKAMFCLAGPGTDGGSFSLHSFRFTFAYLIYFLIMVFMPRRLFGWE